MRRSVERQKAEEARRQARKDEILGYIGAIMAGLSIALPIVFYFN